MRNNYLLRIKNVADPPLSPLCALEQCSIVGSAFITFFFLMRKLNLRNVKYLSKVMQS